MRTKEDIKVIKKLVSEFYKLKGQHNNPDGKKAVEDVEILIQSLPQSQEPKGDLNIVLDNQHPKINLIAQEPKQREVREEEIERLAHSNLYEVWDNLNPNRKSVDYIPNDFIKGHNFGYKQGIRKGLSMKESKSK